MTEKVFNNWIETLDNKTRLIFDKIVYLQEWGKNNSFDEESINELTKSYYDDLDYIYSNEYPFAKILEESDLVVRLEGPAIFSVNPSVSSITKTFEKIVKEVTYVTRAIIGFADEDKKIKDIDLGLTALAKGSLILGFNIPNPGHFKLTNSMFGKDDYLYNASKEAIRNLGLVTKFITEDEDEDKIIDLIKDPKVRDASFVAAKSLLPSKKSGINSVGIGVKEVSKNHLNSLSFNDKKHINDFIKNPIKKSKIIKSYDGIVREIDLDANRFELRQIINREITDIRCIYKKEYYKEIKNLLDKRIRVSGIVEFYNEKPRLMQVSNVSFPENKDQIEIKFLQ
ncbi:MAG: hypothetical protein LWX07_11105 [Bacteroidetes bacterium]|nr:hypothetical protein [Bacteroidota bacterium]